MLGTAGYIRGLATYDLVCDASGFGLKGILNQQGRPNAFWSRKMVPADASITSMDKELLAVAYPVKAFRC